jgi:hypothetical protein
MNGMAEVLKGHCLCGAVTITVSAHEHSASACHCSMCRRWTGSALWLFYAHPQDVTVSGPVKTFRATSFAERAFCEVCGTHLWMRDDDGADYELVPGVFDTARDMALSREIYADKAYACVTLKGDHARVTKADYEARKPHVEGGQ